MALTSHRPPVRGVCPACGPVDALYTHLRERHGFAGAIAKALAGRIIRGEKLGRATCERLGIAPQSSAVTYVRRRAVDEAPSAGYPTDAELDRRIAEAFGS